MKTEASGQIVRQPKPAAPERRPDDSNAGRMSVILGKLSKDLAAALPSHLTPERMTRLALTAIRVNPKLADDPPSFVASLFQLAAIGLEANTLLGHAYLIPRWSSKLNRNTCTVQIGYQGFLELSRRSGMIAGIQAVPVYRGDHFVVSMGCDPKIDHVPDYSHPDYGTAAGLVQCYAVARLKESGTLPIFVVLTRAQIEERRNRGGYNLKDPTGPWVTDFIAMAQKTAIRALSHWLPLSAEIARAVAADEGAERGAHPWRQLDPDLAASIAGTIEPPQELEDDDPGGPPEIRAEATAAQ